ncbi:F-box protein GID2 [Argentina anserina]|uniref:F-box protein GID2 n=1 Tax=Argentina anserina TaxID=57926 RepID=UPI0021765A72|nr:F-box protein GID2 [Potentilla anserina]
MKRGLSSMAEDDDSKMKKLKVEEEAEEGGVVEGPGLTNLDDNLMFEVFKHVDARTLGMASCVSKQWHKTAQDERLWELICSRHWANIGYGNQQLRSVVLALGGFRRLHSLYIWPFTKPPSSSSSAAASSSAPSSSWAAAAPLKPVMAAKPHPRWGKDEVNLSLSLLSIRFYEKMSYNNRSQGR